MRRPRRVWGGVKAFPENFFAPNQNFGPSPLLCLGSINTQSSLNVSAGMRELIMPFMRIPVSVLQNGGALPDFIQGAVFQSIGYQAVNATGNVSDGMFTLSGSYAHNITFNFTNAPTNADVVGLVLNDFSGGDGWGALGINGIQVHKDGCDPPICTRRRPCAPGACSRLTRPCRPLQRAVPYGRDEAAASAPPP